MRAGSRNHQNISSAGPGNRARLLFLLVSFTAAATVRADSFLTPIGGSGGGQFVAKCPVGQHLTGFDLKVGDDVDAIRPVCVISYGPVEISAVPPMTDSGWNGGPGGGPMRLLCPASTPVVVGLDVGFEGITTVVNNLYLFCGRAVSAQTPPPYPSAVFDAPQYDRLRAPGFQSQRCPPGEVAIGVHGFSGKWLDSVGLICGPSHVDNSKAGGLVLGRVSKAPPDDTAHRTGSICDSARNARARNSPAAPNLEKYCREYLASNPPIPTSRSGAPMSVCDAAQQAKDQKLPSAAALAAQCAAAGGAVDGKTDSDRKLDELERAGRSIAVDDPLIARLISLKPGNDRYTRGSAIGIATCGTNTQWGPGKQKILDSLPVQEQEAFKVATSFCMDRNQNAKLAAIGAAIAEADPLVAKARLGPADPRYPGGSESDPRYSLGFDIASGVFGDRALGAQGNTAAGPGALRVRDSLSTPAQRGFNDSIKFHLARHY